MGARDGQEREVNNIGWGVCGEMAAVANTEWADGRPHGAVKHAMVEQVVDIFERET